MKKYKVQLKRSTPYKVTLYAAFIGGLLITSMINSCGQSHPVKTEITTQKTINIK